MRRLAIVAVLLAAVVVWHWRRRRHLHARVVGATLGLLSLYAAVRAPR